MNLSAGLYFVSDHNMLDFKGLPMFPLNTDGYDIQGNDVLIENVEITNFDDAVAVQAVNSGGQWSDCAEDITVSLYRVISNTICNS